MPSKKIALVGNTNVGKTTFLNTIAGVFQETSNYPGTTVEIFRTIVKQNNTQYEISDLPGVYSLSPYTEEEKVTHDILLNEKFDLVIQVIDPKAKKRSLDLTLELLELGLPVFIVVNNINNRWQRADDLLQILKKELKLEGISINAALPQSKQIFFKTIKNHQAKNTQNICNQIHKSLKTEISQIKQKSQTDNLHIILQKLSHSKNNKDYSLKIKHNRHKFIDNKLYPFFASSSQQHTSSFSHLSRKLDQYFLNSWLGIPFFFFLMWVMFKTTFTLGAIPMDWINLLFSNIQSFLSTKLPTNLYSSILIDGIIGGVGATLIFLPNIIILVFFLAILKQSGYLSRTAYLLDHQMQKVGLGGRSFVPLLMGFGCNVPAIMATRTLSTKKERIITSLMIPFMSCGARLPVYSIFIAAFFEEKWRGSFLFGLYLFGVLMSFITGIFFRKIITEKKRPLLLELPVYHIPKIKSIIIEVWYSAKAFLKKAGKVILPFSIILWILFTFPQNNVGQTKIENSYAAQIGQSLSPLFEPLGFDWRITTGLIAGLGAKEVVITTFGTLYSLENEDKSGLITSFQNDSTLTPLSVISLLFFILIYTPCIAVIGVFNKEFGKKWAFIAFIYPTILAWIVSFLIYQIGGILF